MLSKKERNYRHLNGFFPVIYNDLKKSISSLKLEKIMVNIAYLSLKQKNMDIHEAMNFKGMIFLDSGVFQRGFYLKKFDKHQIIDYRDDLIKWYNFLKPNYASSFDLPIPFPSDMKRKRSRISWTIENFKVMKNFLDIPLVIGLSLFSRSDILYAERKLKEGFKQIPDLLGLGGLVPLMRMSENKPSLGKIIIKTTYQFHKKFPDRSIHVYGLGNRKWYPLIRLVGATSADYAGFNKISGKGGILLPNSLSAKYILKIIKIQTKNGLRYFTRRDRDIFSQEEMKNLYKCDCPICKNSDPHLLEFDRTKRLIHNLFTILKTNENVDKWSYENNMNELISYLKKGPHSKEPNTRKIVEYAIKIMK